MVFQRLFKSGFLAPSADRVAAEALYTAIVAQARHPYLYVELGVPDDIDGRFESIVLHAHLVLRRLGRDSEAASIAQAVFDIMFHDMDRSLRAIGVGDMSVGKKIKQMGAAFYGRVGSYETALSSGDRNALAEALLRNVAGASPDTEDGMTRDQALALARYAECQAEALAGQETVDLMRGEVRFEDPGRTESKQEAGEARA